MENINAIIAKNAEVAKIIEDREKQSLPAILKKKYGAKNYGIARRILTSGVQGEDAPQIPMEPGDIEKFDAFLNPQPKSKGGTTTKNRIGGNDYRKGGYVLSTVDNRKKKQ
jgi:hypothetical protein